MGNFKVKTDKKTYNQVKSLLLESGFRISAPTGKDWVIGELGGIISSYSDWNGKPPEWFYTIKEVTIADLRDMVVLKRNDVNDATHESSIYKYFKACDDWYYFDLGCTDKWQKSAGAKPEYYEKLKPIEKKEMKEYLNKETYAYVKTHNLVSKDSNWIEIPEGAEIAIQFKDDPIDHGVIFYKDGGKSCIGENDNNWQHDSDWSMDQLLNENYHDGEIDLSHWILWKRTPSLNDQYAEIEHVRQHRHYFIDVSDVDEIDFYEIALRYNVTDPCIQHILKKCLAVGQRGQKDFHHDLKDIYDTAKRMLDVHGLDS